jgi:hypothetical protein
MQPFRRDSFLGRSGTACRLVSKLCINASTLVPRASGLLGLIILAALVTTLLGCSPAAEREKQHAGRDARQTTAHQGTTSSGKRVEDAPARETATDFVIRWDYVALGDSLEEVRGRLLPPSCRWHSPGLGMHPSTRSVPGKALIHET